MAVMEVYMAKQGRVYKPLIHTEEGCSNTRGFAQDITSSLQGTRIASALVMLLHYLGTVYNIG